MAKLKTEDHLRRNIESSAGPRVSTYTPAPAAPPAMAGDRRVLPASCDSPCPQPPGGRTAIPAARKYAPTVSRRMCAALSMRRNDQPSRPNAMTCCFFSSLKTLLA
jgi:hypothetical protein